MAKTITSSATSYCTGTQALLFVDKRLWGDLLKDDGTRDANPAVNPTLADLLLAASGDVEMACLRGHKYEVADLQAIAAANPKVAATNSLAEMVAWLAYDKCQSRRQPNAAELRRLQEQQKKLAALQAGEEIWQFTEAQDAGLPDVTPVQPAGGDFDTKRVVRLAKRFFGSHADV